MFHDASGKEGIDRVCRNGQFVPISNRFSLGHLEGNVWLKLPLVNPSDRPQKVIVSLSEAFFRHAEFYVFNKEGILILQRDCGLRGKCDERYDMLPSADIPLSSHERVVVYVRLQSSYGFFGALEVHAGKSFFHSRVFQYVFDFFYLGIVFSVLLFSLTYYRYLREKVYLVYAAYLAVFLVPALLYMGHGSWLVQGSWYEPMTLLLFAAFIVLLKLTAIVLDLERTRPSMFRLLHLFALLLAGVTLWSLLDMRRGFIAGIFVSVPLMGLLLYLGVTALPRLKNVARWYLLAIVSFATGMLFFNLLLLGVLPYSVWLHNIPILGSLAEVLFLKTALSERVHMLQQSEQRSRERMLMLEKEQSRLLEEQVAEKTEELRLLLRELHHRVKNNFQSMLAFLWMQREKHRHSEANEALSEVSRRIETMAAIHETLFAAADGKVEFENALRRLLGCECQEGKRVDVRYTIAPCRFDPKTATTLGMIAGELWTNSCKHAFSQTDSPSVRVALRTENGTCIFLYEDNGAGFDPESAPKGIGRSLIEQLVKTLPGGKMHYEQGTRMRFHISFEFECQCDTRSP
jgi:two-component sensor histidine kinase